MVVEEDRWNWCEGRGRDEGTRDRKQGLPPAYLNRPPHRNLSIDAERAPIRTRPALRGVCLHRPPDRLVKGTMALAKSHFRMVALVNVCGSVG